MNRVMNKALNRALRLSLAGWALLAAFVVSPGGPARAQEMYSSPEALWDRYCKSVGSRDDVEVLSCYAEDLRRQLAGDGTAAGRARLDVHMSELFELLAKDYDYTTTGEKKHGNKVTHSLKFKHRKKDLEHNTTVEFLEGDERWFVNRPPQMPSFFSAGDGTFKMIAGIVVAIILIGFILRKALG